MGVQPRGPSATTHRRRAPSTPGSSTSKRAKSSASPPHQTLARPGAMPSVMSANAPPSHPSLVGGPYPPALWPPQQQMHAGEQQQPDGHPPQHRPPPLELSTPWAGGPPQGPSYYGEPIGPYGPAQHGGPSDWDRRPSLPPIASMYAQPGGPHMGQPPPPSPTGYAPYPYHPQYGYAQYMPAPPQHPHPQYVGYSTSPPTSAYGLPPNSPRNAMWTYSGMSATEAAAASGQPAPNPSYTGSSAAAASSTASASPTSMAFAAPTAVTHMHPPAPAPGSRPPSNTPSDGHHGPPRASASPSAPTSFSGSPHELDPTHAGGSNGGAGPSYQLAPGPRGADGDKRHSLGELCADDATPRMAVGDPGAWMRSAGGAEALGLAPAAETPSY